ncbi:YHS domain-containing (seleno)protein [Hoeflea ulvae]|uniref:Tat pathway signal sequence domain protein n=1 Tax=Hoeflea ulvae TaxID=2983764 RepID=A0ABT3YJV6_9HYPH|nr:YHS domain-containing (seleno)protein [Hoeflea ulvae]MCY0096176.1 tat pathway signal sequence domain protein [Hoeflea ulvae]
MSIFKIIRKAIAMPLLALAVLTGAAMAGETNLSFHGIAIQGHDPVAYFTQGKPVPGDPDITATHDGAIYQFASAEHKAAFQADPARYAPQYGGYCAYGASQGYNAPVEPEQFTIADGKLYLNYNADVRKRWNEDRGSYISKADAYWASK